MPSFEASEVQLTASLIASYGAEIGFRLVTAGLQALCKSALVAVAPYWLGVSSRFLASFSPFSNRDMLQ